MCFLELILFTFYHILCLKHTHFFCNSNTSHYSNMSLNETTSQNKVSVPHTRVFCYKWSTKVIPNNFHQHSSFLKSLLFLYINSRDIWPNFICLRRKIMSLPQIYYMSHYNKIIQAFFSKILSSTLH